MPAYDYSCRTCGTCFEVVQSFSEDTLVRCPPADSPASPSACTQPGQGEVAKVFSVPSITFKGDGFYRNDSRSGAKSSTTAGSSSNGDNAGSKEKSDSDSSDSSSREPAKASSGSSSSTSSSED